jgi:hypothetical protein
MMRRGSTPPKSTVSRVTAILTSAERSVVMRRWAALRCPSSMVRNSSSVMGGATKAQDRVDVSLTGAEAVVPSGRVIECVVIRVPIGRARSVSAGSCIARYGGPAGNVTRRG